MEVAMQSQLEQSLAFSIMHHVRSHWPASLHQHNLLNHHLSTLCIFSWSFAILLIHLTSTAWLISPTLNSNRHVLSLNHLLEFSSSLSLAICKTCIDGYRRPEFPQQILNSCVRETSSIATEGLQGGRRLWVANGRRSLVTLRVRLLGW